MNDTNRPLAVGDTLHGFCGGIFGRDHYDCCTIEALGPDWIVTRNAEGGIDFTAGQDRLGRLREHRQPTTDVNGDPCCRQPAPAVTVRYVPTYQPGCQDCGWVWHPGYTCDAAAKQNAIIADAFNRLLPKALDCGEVGPAFTNPPSPAA